MSWSSRNDYSSSWNNDWSTNDWSCKGWDNQHPSRRNWGEERITKTGTEDNNPRIEVINVDTDQDSDIDMVLPPQPGKTH